MKKLRFIISLTVIMSLFLSIFSIDTLALQKTAISGGEKLKAIVTSHSINSSLYSESQAEDTSYAQSVYLRSAIKDNEALSNCYGGSYINDNKELVVWLKQDISKETRGIVENILNGGSTIYQKCEYSLSELESLKEYISSFWDITTENTELFELINSMVGVGIYEQHNKVFVEILNCDSNKIDLFKQYISASEAVVFQNASQYENQVALNAGAPITIDDGKGYSIGFRCRKLTSTGSYINGFMTAGHGNGLGQNVYNSAGVYTGYIFAWSLTNNGTVDGAFVYVTNTSDSLSNTVANSSLTLTSGAYINSFTTGKTVYKSGKKTGLTSGTITSTSHNSRADGITVKDCVRASYHSDGGDSGGVVYMIVNGAPYVAGIHRSGAKDDTVDLGVFVKVSNLKIVFQIVLY